MKDVSEMPEGKTNIFKLGLTIVHHYFKDKVRVPNLY
jgi:hypothetical protein